MARAASQASDADWFRRGLGEIMRGYVSARAHDRMDASHALWRQARLLRAHLEGTPSVASRSHLKVRWSFGQGAWARIPWVALLDERVARATSAGVYAIYLFCEDMSGVYVTLNQGVTKEKERLGADAGRRLVRARSDDLRRHAQELGNEGFILSNDIDLHTTHSVGKDYAHGTVAHKCYSSTAIPSTRGLLRDLERVLVVYEQTIVAAATGAE